MLSRVAFLSTLALGLVVGCSSTAKDGSPSSNGSLGASEDALTADDNASKEAEDGAEDGIENGLSGATPSDPGTPATGGNVEAIDATIRTNPGLYFRPAGCIVSTRVSQGVWNHVFTNCTGPRGHVTYNGTVKSTWTVSPGQVEVKHEATNFTMMGARFTTTLSGSRDVTYTRSGTVFTKHRVGNWTGTITKNGDAGSPEPWSHQADFTSTWDAATKCYTRDGSASNSVGNRTFGRKVTGYKICGEIFACPQSGTFEVDRKDGSVKITETFLGGQNAEITDARGVTVKVPLICDPS